MNSRVRMQLFACKASGYCSCKSCLRHYLTTMSTTTSVCRLRGSARALCATDRQTVRERFDWIECVRATQRLHNEASDPFLPFWSMLPSRMHKYFKMDVGDGWAKSVLLLLFVWEGWVWVMVIGFDAPDKQPVALQKHKQNTHTSTRRARSFR